MKMLEEGVGDDRADKFKKIHRDLRNFEWTPESHKGKGS